MKRQGDGLASSTISKYRTFIKQLTAFADKRGYVFMDHFNVDDMDVFYATWALSPRTKSNRPWAPRKYPLTCGDPACSMRVSPQIVIHATGFFIVLLDISKGLHRDE